MPDTYKSVKIREQNGFNERQAEAIGAIIVNQNEQLATKADITGLRGLVGISIALSLAAIGGIIAVLILLVQLIARV